MNEEFLRDQPIAACLPNLKSISGGNGKAYWPGMQQEAHLLENFVNMKCQRVKVDESFVPALEDDALELEHLLAEPKNDLVSVDGVLCFSKENPETCLGIEDIPCMFAYDSNASSGGLDSNITREKENELRLKISGQMLDEVGELGDLHATNGLSNACEDYLLDIDMVEKGSRLDNGPSIENSCSESHSPGFSGNDVDPVGMSDSPRATNPVPECQSYILDTRTTFELHDSCGGECGCDGPDDKLDSNSSLLEGSVSSSKDKICARGPIPEITYYTSSNEGVSKYNPGLVEEGLCGQDASKKSLVEASEIGEFLTRKRLRKPTRRYIEEFSNLKSRYLKGKRKIATTTSKNKPLGVRSLNEHQVGLRALTSVPGKASTGGSHYQASFGLCEQKGHPKKNTSILELDSDDNLSQTESEDECMMRTRSAKGVDRRKNQKLWTLSEVMMLVDGVYQYGVGRWTDIKRLSFSSSAYRTPIDLRDKWRNLLRSSHAHLQGRREVEQNRKHALRPLPKSLLNRVRELAIMHPYPRECKSRISHLGHVTPVLARSECDAFSPRGRIVPRKNRA
ncbi:uncharacterized protein LOC131167919 [Malania oleifera]|uniref:uncharacterized protein LOC131167919 n=1 Tax=Malania oleifera TaxID=397392 RepID=UPI0025ADAAA0|nr:uncharacterized protein LOC131167919 [Malania oleifera]